ncbi:MAG: hypothetical protein SNJ78_13155 [Spirochaetales bacterium]
MGLANEKFLYVQMAVKFEQRGVGKQTLVLKDEHVWLLDLRTGALRCMDVGTKPMFSPDGKWILYTKNNELWSISIAGKLNRRIGLGSHPVFSPDCKKIAFVDTGFDGTAYHWLNLCVFDVP